MLELWADSLRCHSKTPGFGVADGDEPFVLVAVIDLENRNALGIPATQVWLYGPLDDVEDQQNRTFQFLPFGTARSHQTRQSFSLQYSSTTTSIQN